MKGIEQMFENGKKAEARACGCQSWSNQAGYLHRLAGPSFVSCRGVEQYCIQGKTFTKEQHEEKTQQIVKEAIQEIRNKLVKCYVWIGCLRNKGEDVFTLYRDCSDIEEEFEDCLDELRVDDVGINETGIDETIGEVLNDFLCESGTLGHYDV